MLFLGANDAGPGPAQSPDAPWAHPPHPAADSLHHPCSERSNGDYSVQKKGGRGNDTRQEGKNEENHKKTLPSEEGVSNQCFLLPYPSQQDHVLMGPFQLKIFLWFMKKHPSLLSPFLAAHRSTSHTAPLHLPYLLC